MAARLSTLAMTDAHPGRAGVLHDGADIGKVQVDDAGNGDNLSDSLDAMMENFVGHAEGAIDAGLGVADFK